MSPEEKELLKRSVALGEQNNDILRSMQRSMRMAHFASIFYWIFIILVALGGFYFVQPYLGRLTSLYETASKVINNYNNK